MRKDKRIYEHMVGPAKLSMAHVSYREFYVIDSLLRK